MTQPNPDKLDRIFDEQRKLNYKFGVLVNPANPASVNTWLRNFATAIQQEAAELMDSTKWKWWAKGGLDIQNARVEIVDILHFLVSAAMATGLTSEELFDLYMKKNQVNHDRQSPGYDREKEPDNKSVVVGFPALPEESYEVTMVTNGDGDIIKQDVHATGDCPASPSPNDCGHNHPIVQVPPERPDVPVEGVKPAENIKKQDFVGHDFPAVSVELCNMNAPKPYITQCSRCGTVIVFAWKFGATLISGAYHCPGYAVNR